LIRTHQEAPFDWAQTHFGEVDLGDPRRDQFAIAVATAMATNPDKSIPQMFRRRYDIKASYTFFRRPEATPANLQQAHRELVLEQLHQAGRYLLVEDSSEFGWPGNEPIPGLGPIGSGADGLQGFHLHSALAVRWRWEAEEPSRWPGRPAVEVLGLPSQHYHVRQPRPKGEPANHSKLAKLRARESQWWIEAGETIGPAPENEEVEWTRVCDRGADIYEQMVSCEELDHRFNIRAAQDRCLTNEQGRAVTGKLFATARSQAALGQFALELRARPGQPARTAQLQVSAVEVWLRAPQRPGKGPGSLPPVRCTAVRVWETDPPPGVKEALEWILLTDWPVTNYAQALEVALVYSTRWLIEENSQGFENRLGLGSPAVGNRRASDGGGSGDEHRRLALAEPARNGLGTAARPRQCQWLDARRIGGIGRGDQARTADRQRCLVGFGTLGGTPESQTRRSARLANVVARLASIANAGSRF
jgi:hypothetical protein